MTRNNAPVLGAQISPYLQKGEWQLGAGYRQFTADTQYQRTDLSQPVTNNRTQVISKARFLELTAVYAISQQWNVGLGVPITPYASSNRALPAAVPGSPRFIHSATGLGDISVSARYWIMDCDSNPDQNISIGFGLKMPTGESNAQDLFPNALGQDIRVRPVDQSIQLGDGGWGFSVLFEAFKQLGDFTPFASGVYLFNPRGQNKTFSPPALLNPVGPQVVDARFRFNTVSDSYLFRAGTGYAIRPVPGLGLSISGRIEGVPVRDALGDTIGFRRPGYYAATEPGVTYARGRTVLALSVPIRLHQNVKDDAFGIRRDSTFADHVVLLSVNYRIGGR